MAEITARLDHAGLAVADLGASAAWFCGVFGLVPELTLTVEAIDVTDLDGAFDRAVARGARPVMPPCPSPEPGVRMAFVADPEGNLIELLHRKQTAVTRS
jgi:catechol 2,3-dioxygenase-like lactoylglutathione lyase family enzyme